MSKGDRLGKGYIMEIGPYSGQVQQWSFPPWPLSYEEEVECYAYAVKVIRAFLRQGCAVPSYEEVLRDWPDGTRSQWELRRTVRREVYQRACLAMASDLDLLVGYLETAFEHGVTPREDTLFPGPQLLMTRPDVDDHLVEVPKRSWERMFWTARARLASYRASPRVTKSELENRWLDWLARKYLVNAINEERVQPHEPPWPSCCRGVVKEAEFLALAWRSHPRFRYTGVSLGVFMDAWHRKDPLGYIRERHGEEAGDGGTEFLVTGHDESRLRDAIALSREADNPLLGACFLVMENHPEHLDTVVLRTVVRSLGYYGPADILKRGVEGAREALARMWGESADGGSDRERWEETRDQLLERLAWALVRTLGGKERVSPGDVRASYVKVVGASPPVSDTMLSWCIRAAARDSAEC